MNESSCSGVSDAVPLPDDDPHPVVLQMSSLNPYLTCQLCFGYFIDATTIIECTHTFCRSCIVQYLCNGAKTCPTCGALIHEVDPFSRLRLDRTLQDVVYKIFPDVLTEECKRRKIYETELERVRTFRQMQSTSTSTSTSPSSESKTDQTSNNGTEPPVKQRKGRIPNAEIAQARLEKERKERQEATESCASEFITVCLSCKSYSSKASTSAVVSVTPLLADMWLRAPVLMTLGHVKKFLSLKLTPPLSSCSPNIVHASHSPPVKDIIVSIDQRFTPISSHLLLDSATLKRLLLEQLCSDPDDPILHLYWKVNDVDV